MQVFMTLLNIACNMQNMQNNMHDMQNMQTSFPICRICTAHFADDHDVATSYVPDRDVRHRYTSTRRRRRRSTPGGVHHVRHRMSTSDDVVRA